MRAELHASVSAQHGSKLPERANGKLGLLRSQSGPRGDKDKNFCSFQKWNSLVRLLARHFTGLANCRNKIIQECMDQFADICGREVKGACCTLLGRWNTGNRLEFPTETWMFTASPLLEVLVVVSFLSLSNKDLGYAYYIREETVQVQFRL